MRDELAARPHDHREAVLADADLVHHPPHLFEADLTHEPSGGLVEPRQMDRERGGRQLVFIDADRRHRDAVEGDQRVLRHLDAWMTGAAGHDRRAALVEQCDFVEFVELQDVVLQDPVLLRAIETRVLQVGGQRFEQLGVGRHVAGDFSGGARDDVAVAGDHRLAGAAMK